MAFTLVGLCISVGCSPSRMYLPPSPTSLLMPGPNTYAAASLPPEFAAKPIHNPQTLDLTKLAGPTASTERIAAGDILKLSIVGGLSSDAVTTLRVRVENDGTAFLPQIGRVQLAGLQLEGADQRIERACIERKIYTHPQVTVTIDHRRVNRIKVVGAVSSPSVYELPTEQSYLFDAIAAAGGFSDKAGVEVEIRQPRVAGGFERFAGGNPVRPASATDGPDEIFQRVNLVEATTRPCGGVYLNDGSVVMVQRLEPPPIQIVGLVRKPGEYSFPIDRDLRLLGAIGQAGGQSNSLADKVHVIRTREGLSEPILIKVSLMRAKRSLADNIRLEPGDIVAVEPTPLTIALDVISKVGVGFSANPLLY